MSNSTTTSSGQYTPLSQLLGFEPGDFVTVATNKVQRATTMAVEDLDADYAMGLLDQKDTWIGAQPVKPGTPNKRTKASDVACVRVLYADFDLKDSTDPAQIDRAISQLSLQLGVEPISVVSSGGGLHPRWKLAKPIDPADAKGVLARWQITVQRIAEENGFKADSVFDLPRVLRLPGTVNEKYSPAAEVTITARDTKATVPTSAVWSKLDQHKSKLSEKKTAPKPGQEIDLGDAEPVTEVPQKPTQSADVISERYVNSELTRATARLRRLKETGWDGEPWHNTVRDVAFVMAKIGLSPETSISIDEVEQMFRDAVPDDDENADEWDRDVDAAWDTACEAAEGEIFEMVGSGEDVFADEMEAMFSGAAEYSAATTQGLDISLDLDDIGEPEAPAEPRASAADRYAELPLPLVPGFNGAGALRTLPMPDPMPLSLDNRLRVIGEDISDFHEYEHEEYMHPHCPLCFPSVWRDHLYRWLVANPKADPVSMHPPMGRVAPGEGYVDGMELLDLPDSEMMIDGFVPTNAVGILAGRNGTGKTFLALDLAMHILDDSKDKWGLTSVYADEEFGSVNDHGGVMFFAGEGFRSVKSRAQSWLKYNGYGTKPADAPEWLRKFDLRGDVPNFFTGGEDYDLMLDRVARTKPRLVIVDTLQKAVAGADQNSASDMAIVHDRLARLKSVVDGMAVIVIAHSTKDDSSVRGSSSLEDDADFVFHATKASGAQPNQLSVRKQRDGSEPEPLDYYLAPVGRSVVVSSTKSAAVGSLVDERQKIELLSAMHTLHGAKGESAELTMPQIKTVVKTLDQGDIYTMLAHHLIPAALVTRTDAAGSKYQLTPKGRTWLESRDATIFARSKGLS